LTARYRVSEAELEMHVAGAAVQVLTFIPDIFRPFSPAALDLGARFNDRSDLRVWELDLDGSVHYDDALRPEKGGGMGDSYWAAQCMVGLAILPSPGRSRLRCADLTTRIIDFSH